MAEEQALGGAVSESTGVAPSEAPVTTTESAPEKVLRQSEVNSLVGREKHAAYERGKRDALAETQKQSAPQSQQSQQPQMIGGIPQMSQEQLDKIIAERVQKTIQDQAEAYSYQTTLNTFLNKYSAGQNDYKDYKETVESLGLHEFKPEVFNNLMPLLNSVDNTSDVLYEMGKNPGKLTNLLVLQHTNPRLAQAELNKLSTSIKANREAIKSNPNVQEPLSHIKPSMTGIDNGVFTVGDFRNKYRGKV